MKYIITMIALLTTLTVFAQEFDRRAEIEEKMEAQKIAFITQKLDLSPEEAQTFWPVYNEYQSKIRALRNEMKPEVKRPESMSDSEAESVLNDMLKHEEEELALRKRYIQEFRSILPARKVVALVITERQFKDRVLRSIRDRMEKRRDRNMRNGGE